ncbi:helix-turn-helix transcriptional regulator [Salmonella enterica]|uniref:Helix-turn-helix transcriptional regulator n=4 Tax=Salmonella enterica TaxID=28901 RepID=A0A5U7S057_SALER|nr:helix-turn-helix transcriptional regulator [Salmonella enterica]EBS4089017.1 XRE family transcriptional regulator [Salmonella enterica subsp. enterica serovar Newport]EBW8396051.1 XRE family transcriptional regulator [Salmonella enterica subsp. enterica serovar Florida]EBW9463299.1 XRE family transcriptional regulator [Salmonella enterica subsp. enterica serovar Panama]EBZ2512362.1 XRE family transcriptional regulator [Salmonella enterica subsp. enterica serovar Cerro]ECC3916044.1 XRE famil
MKTGVQFITDEKGTKKSVILSISEYERLINEADRDGDYESVPYEAGEHDDDSIPHDVVSIMVDDDVSLLAAWRIYRRMTQKEVAGLLGVKQSAVSQFEKVETPRKATLEKLAEIYDCRVGQLAD